MYSANFLFASDVTGFPCPVKITLISISPSFSMDFLYCSGSGINLDPGPLILPSAYCRLSPVNITLFMGL